MAAAGVATGRDPDTSDPAGVVRRGQMGSFLVRLLDLLEA
jgi:hypothetical protein